MVKTHTINKVKFAFGVVLLFGTSSILQFNLLVPALLLTLALYIRFRDSYLLDYKLLYLIFIFVLAVTGSYSIVNQGWSKLYLPFSAAAMLTTLLFNQLELSLLITLATALTIAAICGNHLYLGMLFLVSGIASSFLLFSARRRITVIRAGIIISLLQATLLFFIERPWLAGAQIHLGSYLVIALNGMIYSIVILGVLPVFEYLFKTVTNISLLELADFNQPVLQQMVLEAPGTYHHSLIVGNLSEAACRAINANALLARIGAYYHDIGKLSQPEYFSENQGIKESKHDNLTATMSKLIIMNHIKEGVELAKRHKLNPKIIEFIEQHHGNSLVYYFYRRALENLEIDQAVKEEGFRYPGPKPNTKETAIVLLADSVEAATRALKNPEPKRIEELVHKVINSKFIDGQLDACELTLKDLEKISAVFIRILTGIYHSRVEYTQEAIKGEPR